MSWYKKAKLVDKRGLTDARPITVKCMYCLRWATHPASEVVPKEEYVWKKPEVLDSEESLTAKSTLSNNEVSSAICPYCWNIMEKHGHRISPNKVKALSLMINNL